MSHSFNLLPDGCNSAILCRTHADNDYSEHKLILGTHTSGDEPNYLMIAEVLLPSENAVIDATKYDEERGGAWRAVGAASCCFHLMATVCFPSIHLLAACMHDVLEANCPSIAPSELAELGGYGLNKSKVKISVRIVHDREVNRARYCPQNSFLIGA